MEDRHLMELDESFENVLLSTIRVPKNLHFLTERLPKANYTPAKLHKVEKQKFLHTLGYKERKPYDDRLDGYYDDAPNTKLPPIKESLPPINNGLPPINSGQQSRVITNRVIKEDLVHKPQPLPKQGRFNLARKSVPIQEYLMM